MAKWVIIREEEQVHLQYHNLIVGNQESCGSMSANVPDEMILEWILTKGKPAYGDRIILSDGSYIDYQPAKVSIGRN